MSDPGAGAESNISEVFLRNLTAVSNNLSNYGIKLEYQSLLDSGVLNEKVHGILKRIQDVINESSNDRKFRDKTTFLDLMVYICKNIFDTTWSSTSNSACVLEKVYRSEPDLQTYTLKDRILIKIFCMSIPALNSKGLLAEACQGHLNNLDMGGCSNVDITISLKRDAEQNIEVWERMVAGITDHTQGALSRSSAGDTIRTAAVNTSKVTDAAAAAKDSAADAAISAADARESADKAGTESSLAVHAADIAESAAEEAVQALEAIKSQIQAMLIAYQQQQQQQQQQQPDTQGEFAALEQEVVGLQRILHSVNDRVTSNEDSMNKKIREISVSLASVIGSFEKFKSVDPVLKSDLLDIEARMNRSMWKLQHDILGVYDKIIPTLEETITEHKQVLDSRITKTDTELRGQIEELKSEMKTGNVESTATRAKIEQLESRLQNNETNLVQLRAETEEARRIADRAQVTADSVRYTAEQASRDVQTIQQTLREINTDLGKLDGETTSKFSGLDATLSGLKEGFEGLNQYRESNEEYLRQMIKQIDKALIKVYADFDQFKDEQNITLGTKLVEMEGKLTKTMNDLVNGITGYFGDEITRLKETIDRNNHELKNEIDTKIDSLRTEAVTGNTAAQQQIDDLKATLATLLAAQSSAAAQGAAAAAPGTRPGASKPIRLGMDIDLTGNFVGGKEIIIQFIDGSRIRSKYLDGDNYSKVMENVMKSEQFNKFPKNIQEILKGNIKLIYRGELMYERHSCNRPEKKEDVNEDCWVAEAIVAASLAPLGAVTPLTPAEDKEIESHSQPHKVECVSVADNDNTPNDDLFKEFKTKYNENLKGSKISMYNNEEVQIDCTMTGDKIFEKLERELFHSTYSDYLRNYLNCNENPLYNRLGSVWDLSDTYNGKANTSATFKSNYGDGADNFYLNTYTLFHTEKTREQYIAEIENLNTAPGKFNNANQATVYNAATHLTSSAQKYENYEVFIKAVCDYINGELEWLNEQIKLVNADGGECIFKTYKKYRGIYDIIFNIPEKGCGSGPNDPVWCNLKPEVTKEQFLNGLSKAKSEYPEDYEKFIKDINEKRVKIGLLPCGEYTHTSSTEDGDDKGDSDKDDEEEEIRVDEISIKGLNSILEQVDSKLNNSKTSESSTELYELSTDIQDYVRDEQFEDYLVKSAQSRANRYGNQERVRMVDNKPVDEYGEPLSEEDIKLKLDPQVAKTLYLDVVWAGAGNLIPTSSTTKEYYFNEKYIIIPISDSDRLKFKKGMTLKNIEGVEKRGRIKEIVEDNNSGLYYDHIMVNNQLTPTPILMPYLLIDNHDDITGGIWSHAADVQLVKKTDGTLSGQKAFKKQLCDITIQPGTPCFEFEDEGVDSLTQFNEYCENPKFDFGSVEDPTKVEIYNKLLTSILSSSWKDLFSLEGMILQCLPYERLEGSEWFTNTNDIKPTYDEVDNVGDQHKKLNIQLVGNGNLVNTVKKVKQIERKFVTKKNKMKLTRKTGKKLNGLIIYTRNEYFDVNSYHVDDRHYRAIGRSLIRGGPLKSAAGLTADTIKYGTLGVVASNPITAPVTAPLAAAYATKKGYDKLRSASKKKSSDIMEFKQKGGADPSWTSSVVTSKERRSLERLKKSLDYNFTTDTQSKYKEDVSTNNNLKNKIKEDIQEIIGAVPDNPTTPEPKDIKDSRTKDLEDKLKTLIQEQNKRGTSSSSSDLSRQISALKGQLSAQQRPQQQQPRTQTQQTLKPQQSVRPGQQPVKPGQQPVKPGQQPVKPVQQPVNPGQPVPGQSGVSDTDKKEPSLLDRLFGSSSEKEQLDKEREEFEKQKEDDEKEKQMNEKMEELKKVETIQTDLFKQLPDKSSPEYERVKKLMIEQIKLIHKYNLLKQESFQLMLENSKCDTLEEENKEQKEKIADLENNIFNIIKQILSSKTSNKGLNKLNRDLLSYIDDLKSSNPDGSLVDTDRYLDLIKSVDNTNRKKTLRKVKKKQDAKKSKDEKKKKTPNKLRKKITPRKGNVKKTPVKPKITPVKPKITPVKPKITKVYKKKRTPTKPKKVNKVQRTPTKPKK